MSETVIRIGTQRIPLKFKTPEDEQRFGTAIKNLAKRLDSMPEGQMGFNDAMKFLLDELKPPA